MALMKISEYRLGFTPASRPDPRTVINWIRKGQIYGERRGRDWYVDPTRPVQPQPAPYPTPPAQDLNPLAKKILGL